MRNKKQTTMNKAQRFSYKLKREVRHLTASFRPDGYRFLSFAPPGHYYSPIPDLKHIRAHADTIFNRQVSDLPGLNLNEQTQLALGKEMSKYYPEMPFPQNEDKRPKILFRQCVLQLRRRNHPLPDHAPVSASKDR
jgi:hypothetical protein